MSEVIRPVWAEVDLGAVQANIRSIKHLVEPQTAVMAVVKADGYGHGARSVAEAAVAAGVDKLGVALVEEAVDLRAAGLSVPIQILSEPPIEAADDIIEHDITPTIYTEAAAQALSAAALRQQRQLDVHIKVDTGMHRVGAAPADALALAELVDRLPALRLEGMMTHFACADDPDDDYTDRQLKTFLALREKLPAVPVWHAANSAGAFFWPQSRLDMVRIGIAMYGLEPSISPSPVPLSPALTLKAEVTYIQNLAAGEGVSYGLTYRAASPQAVAVIPLGYGDGFSRRLSNLGSALVGGRRAPLIGNICMDQALIEVEESVRVGDEVVLIGTQGDEKVTAEELAGIIGTINYEVVCMINSRVPRRYLSVSDSSTSVAP